jgi:hypothetical protein
MIKTALSKMVVVIVLNLIFTSCAHREVSETTQSYQKPSGFVLVREYIDSVKTDAGDIYQKVQYGWDYDQGMAVERIYDLQDQLISQQTQEGMTLETTEPELQYAYWLVRQHRDLKKVCARKDARFYGGFSLRNGSDTQAKPRICVSKSRCVHVIVSGGPNGEEALAHAIVDLALGQVVDAHFQGNKKITTNKN